MEVFDKGRDERTDGLERVQCLKAPEDACEARARVSFTAVPGRHQVAGVLAFSVCNAEQCPIEKVPLAAAVTAH